MKKNATKRALLMSVLSLMLCVSMLIGTTFAWFTDSVTSANNIIKSGNLDVEMYWAEGIEDPENATWTDASTGAIFDYDLWEPGYTEIRHIKIENKGTLALKYEVKIVPNGEVSILADVIDVYYVDPAVQVANRTELTDANKLGTLTDVLARLDETGNGALLAGEKDTITIALKMQETAGNEYQNKSIGTDFYIQLFATQYTHEEDSFDNQYDADAKLVVASSVQDLKDALENAGPGAEIMLAAGTYELSEALEIPSNVTIYGAQAGKAAKNWATDPDAAKTVIKSTGTNVLEIRQSSDDPAEATANITIDGIMIDCDNNDVKGIYVKKSNGEAMEGIKIVNCAVVNSANDGIDVCNTYGAVIENNYVRNVKDTGIHLGNYNGYHYETWAEVTAYVRNNVIDGVSYTQNGAIQIENGMGDVVVSGNVIKNVVAGDPEWGSSPVKASAITVYDVYEGGRIRIENNTIENADQGIAIYKYSRNGYIGEDWWNGPSADIDVVTVSNNTISGFTNFGIATSNLNHKNRQDLPLVVIDGNTLYSATSSNAISPDGTGVVTNTNNTTN